MPADMPNQGAHLQIMDINVGQKRTITRYLLGEMSEQERSEFEDRYLDDPILFEESIAAEDEMMRCYIRGDLPEAARTAFEARYLKNHGNRRRVDFTRSLMTYASSMHEAVPGTANLGDIAIAPNSR